jgi:hypothetical protein
MIRDENTAKAVWKRVIKPVRITTAKGPGWGPDDPMHITPETKITIADPPPRSWRTNTYSLLGG